MLLNNFKKILPSDDDKAQCSQLQKKLGGMQQSVRAANLPIIILLEGWSTSGKSRMVSELISELDPRSFQVYPHSGQNDTERPFLWKYWNEIPPKGEISIFCGGWYSDLFSFEEKHADSEKLWEIKTFERQMADDGCLVLKFFLHIGDAEQHRRLKKLCSNENERWRVTEKDLEQNMHYKKIFEALDDTLDKTSPDFAPWHIIWNKDKKSGAVQVLSVIIDEVEKALAGGIAKSQGSIFTPKLLPMPYLKDVDLSHVASPDKYSDELDREQKKLKKLHKELFLKKIPVIIGFEGWDAAGKGGAIRRLSRSLDPCGFDVIPIAAPTPEALNHQYLWRFWREIPEAGHIAIFDRTWYGRVMVERLENITPPQRWQEAYGEINEFEKILHDWGAIQLKFWLQIDKSTQLERFTLRQNTPEKQYKITDEDWRNREKWDKYETAVDEMLQKTSTEYTPWTIIEGNDKKYARLKVLKTVREAIEKRLGQ